MSDDSVSFSPRRLLVAADASPHSQAALDAAVRLAAAFGAEVEGLFVKDERLLHAAGLPFAAEVRAHSRPPKPLTDRRLQRQLRHQAERAEAALRRTAESAEVEHTFRVVEGDVTQEILSAAEAADVLALGKTSTASSRQRLGSTAQTVLARSPAPVLMLREPVRPHQPVLTYYDGTEAGEATLQAAAALAMRTNVRTLRVLLPTEDTLDHDRLRKTVQTRFADAPLSVSVHVLTASETARLAVLAHRSGNGLVVFPSGHAALSPDALQQFLYDLDRPLLVVPPHRRPASMTSSDAPVSRLTLTTPPDAPFTPHEVLSDFADATAGWTYLEDDSQHYADRKARPALVLRYRRNGSPGLIDFAFVAPPDAPHALGLVLLDAPDAQAPVPPEEQSALVETLLSALRDYLDARPTSTSLTIERAAPDA